MLEDAAGGTLLIDEAYRLVPQNSSRDFGREAMDTIMATIEGSSATTSDRPAFIFAGWCIQYLYLFLYLDVWVGVLLFWQVQKVIKFMVIFRVRCDQSPHGNLILMQHQIAKGGKIASRMCSPRGVSVFD